MSHTVPSQSTSSIPSVAPQALVNWQALLQQTVIQSHLGSVMMLPRWAEVSQPWKAS